MMLRKICLVLLLILLAGCMSGKGNLTVELGGVLGYLDNAEIEISKVEIGGVDFGGALLKGNQLVVLDAKEIKTGKYDSVKIYWKIGQMSKGGQNFALEMPSEATPVNEEFTVAKGDNRLRINVDLDASSVKVGPSSYRFKPVVGIDQNI